MVRYSTPHLGRPQPRWYPWKVVRKVVRLWMRFPLRRLQIKIQVVALFTLCAQHWTIYIMFRINRIWAALCSSVSFKIIMVPKSLDSESLQLVISDAFAVVMLLLIQSLNIVHYEIDLRMLRAWDSIHIVSKFTSSFGMWAVCESVGI